MYICLGEPQVNQNESHPHGFFVINIGSDFKAEQFSLKASSSRERI